MKRTVVIIEDNPADSKILSLALTRRDPTLDIKVLDDGTRAVDYFTNAKQAGQPAAYDLIILDLNLPRISGFEILEFLKGDVDLRKTPVIMLSGSSTKEDIEHCYAAGASSYISKPPQLEDVFRMAARLIEYWFETVSLPSGRASDLGGIVTLKSNLTNH